MTSTLTPPVYSSTSIDPRQLQLPPDSTSAAQISNQTSHTPLDSHTLSPYSVGQPYSSSASPSIFDTPPDVDGGYSEFTQYNGGDEFFGLNFDTSGLQNIGPNDVNQEDIAIPSTEVTPIDANLPEPDFATKHSINGFASSPLNTHDIKSPRLYIPSDTTNLNIHGSNARSQNQRDISVPSVSNVPYSSPSVAVNMQSTHEYSDAKGVGPSLLIQQENSPRVTITPWGTGEEQDLPAGSETGDMPFDKELPRIPTSSDSADFLGNQADASTFPLYSTQRGQSVAPQYSPWDAEPESGRTGIAPERRSSLSDVQVPNFKDQERKELLDMQLRQVEQWRSKATESIDIAAKQPQSSLATDIAQRRRAKTTGAPMNATRNDFGRDFTFPTTFEPTPQDSRDPEEGNGIEPVSDAASIRENRLQDGQTYFNENASQINHRDVGYMTQNRHFVDGPSFPRSVAYKSQPDTANAAMAKYNEAVDTWSLLSRSATWGTRRRSEPSLADIESLENGSFIKRLSFGRDKKEKKPGYLGQLTNMVRKKSDSKNKRSRAERDARGRPEMLGSQRKPSQSSLAPPARSPSANRQLPTSPRLNTNVGHNTTVRRTHSGSGSLSATSPPSPKNTLGLFNSVLRRARSKSDISRHPENEGLVGMWRSTGGPPVPNLASPPVDAEEAKFPEETKLAEETKPIEHSDVEADEDEEDDFADDGERMEFDQSSPIVPTFVGFREHVLNLNPQMEASYLVDRIAHQQVVHYKTLLNWRVKHSGAVKSGACLSGTHCQELGGSPTLYNSKGHPRKTSISTNGGLQVTSDLSDDESNNEGQLAQENFPPGVPMPPASCLPAEFECQLCFKVKKFQKPSDWTKHVHEDVQPFTCTYSTCREPKSFKRKADWVRHENERHRHLEWWQCQVEDCTHTCYRKDNFLQHLVREHKLPEPKQKTKAAVKKAKGSDEQVWVMVRNCHHETQARPQDEPCKFCGKVLTTWKKLTVHLAKHMEHISLPVLRLVEQRQIDADTIISPVDPLPSRQGPLTPTDMNRALSAGSMPYGLAPHMGGISPQTMRTPQQFASPMHHGPSPNVQSIPQFPDMMFTPNNMYDAGPGAQPMDFGYQTARSQPQQQHNMMYENNGMPFDTFQPLGPQLNSNTSAFTTMDRSPLQGHGFGTITPTYQGQIPQQNFNTPYTSANQSLSPDPNTPFGSAQQQVHNIQGHRHSLTLESAYIAQPQQVSNFQGFDALGINDNNTIAFPNLNAMDLNMDMGFPQLPASHPQSSSPYPANSPQHQAGYGNMPQNRNRALSQSRAQQHQQQPDQSGYQY